ADEIDEAVLAHEPDRSLPSVLPAGVQSVRPDRTASRVVLVPRYYRVERVVHADAAPAHTVRESLLAVRVAYVRRSVRLRHRHGPIHLDESHEQGFVVATYHMHRRALRAYLALHVADELYNLDARGTAVDEIAHEDDLRALWHLWIQLESRCELVE